MNSTIEGQAVALKGRVPVRVTGLIIKGEPIYTAMEGIGDQDNTKGTMVGIALENNDEDGEKLVEVFLKSYHFLFLVNQW